MCSRGCRVLLRGRQDEKPAVSATSAPGAAAKPTKRKGNRNAEEAEKKQEKKQVRTKVYFRWACARLAADEEVRVVGDCPELGKWDTSQGVPLIRHGEGLASRAVALPIRQKVEYKYGICDRHGDFVRWEPRATARCVEPTGTRLVVEDDGGLLRQLKRGDGSIADKADDPSGMGALAGKPRESIKATEMQNVLGEEETVMIVFPNLPVVVKRAEEPGKFYVVTNHAHEAAVLPFLLHFNQKGVADGFKYNVFFVGQPGIFSKDPEERKAITALLAEHRCIPVFVDESTSSQHAEISWKFLWPSFHNIKVFGADATRGGETFNSVFNEAQWKSYKAVNAAFAEVIEKNGTSKSLVWVHDYHLLLVPRNLYLRCPTWGVGLFIHSAFPSSEVFLCLPNREEILLSMLSAKLITFQIFDYMRNFISCCSLLFGASHTFQRGGIMQIEHESKSVALTADHFVLSYQLVKKKLGDPEVFQKVAELKERFKGKVVIGSYDKANSFSGLKLKLRLFHKFLSDYRSHQGKVVLVQFISGDCIDGDGEDSLARQVQELEDQAAVTNKRFGLESEPDPVTIIVDHAGIQTRLASMRFIDLLFDTSINDGLNLNPFFFYAAHAEDEKGLVVLSEFCGCSRALTGSIKVNPWHGEEVMKALDEALTIKDTPLQATRFKKDHSYVSSQSLVQWVTQNLVELKNVVQRASESHQVVGFDACFRPKTAESGFRHLSIDSVEKAYSRAKRRVIFLDNEGTIASKASMRMQAGSTALLSTGCPPNPDILHRLTTLAKDAKNTVVVISGRDKETLSNWFADAAGVRLCAEHGFYYTSSAGPQAKGADDGQRGWQCAGDSAEIHSDWKAVVVELLRQYVKRVQGSIVEIKGSAIVWNYRGVGASMIVNEAALELARFINPGKKGSVLYGYPVKVVCGKGYVEVKRSDIDKGVAVTRVLQQVTASDKGVAPDFVLCIGDDRSDEDMFEAVAKFFNDVIPAEEAPLSPSPLSDSTPLPSPRSPTKPPSEPRRRQSASSTTLPNPRQLGGVGPSAFTVTVGRKPSQASYFLKDVTEVSTLLEKLTKQTVVRSMSRYSSMPQLFDPNAADSDSDTEAVSRHGPRRLTRLAEE